MRSEKYFPKSDRLKNVLILTKNSSYDYDSAKLVIEWIEKYHKALLYAEKELIKLDGDVEIFSEKLIPSKDRIQNGMYISAGKLPYFALIQKLDRYRNALSMVEEQINAIKIKK